MKTSLWLPPILIKIVLTCILWYTVSSVTSQLTKRILIEYNYPLFLSQFQFLIGSLSSLMFIILVKKFPDIRNHFPTGSVPSDSDSPIFSWGAFLKILPLGLFQFGGKYCSLSATSLISLATVSSVKALSPLLIVVSYKFIYDIKFPLVTYLSLVPLLGGVILIITAESPDTNTNRGFLINETNELDINQIKGLAYCVVSLVIFAAQNIYGKQLITWDSSNPANMALSTTKSNSPSDGERSSNKYIRQRNNSIRLPYSTSDLRLDEKKREEHQVYSNTHNEYTKEATSNRFSLANSLESLESLLPESQRVVKPDRMTIIFYCSIIGFCISITGFLFNEMPHISDLLTGRIDESTPDTESGLLLVLNLIVLSSLSHFVQTLLAFHLLGLIPAVSYSVASMMKRIFLITVSIVLGTSEQDPNKYFGKITGSQLIGLLFTGIGLYCYDRWGSKAVKNKA